MPRQFGKRDISVGWSCGKCQHRHEPGSDCPATGIRLATGAPATRQPGVVWNKRPMPEGQWPADPLLPRDDSFNWWVHSHCGHPGGARQWAFYEERDVDTYAEIFRDDPCRYTRCPNRIMIENDGRRR